MTRIAMNTFYDGVCANCDEYFIINCKSDVLRVVLRSRGLVNLLDEPMTTTRYQLKEEERKWQQRY